MIGTLGTFGSKPSEQIDGLAGLADRLAIMRSGWFRHVNAETGEFALFPYTAKSEAEWEQRALAMHEAQEPIRLDAKPEENTLAARKRIMRGD